MPVPAALDEFTRTATEMHAAVSHTHALSNIHLAALPPATKLEIEAALASSAARSKELVQLAEAMKVAWSAAPARYEPDPASPPHVSGRRNPADMSPSLYSDSSLLSSPMSNSVGSPLAADRVALSQPPPEASEAEHTEWKSRVLLRLRRYLSRRLRAERDRHSKATTEAEAADWAARMLEGDLLKVDLSLRQLLRMPPIPDEEALSVPTPPAREQREQRDDDDDEDDEDDEDDDDDDDDDDED